MNKILYVIKMFGGIGAILALMMGIVSYLINMPYSSYIYKKMGISKYGKGDSIMCFLIISIILILGIEIISIDFRILNKILSIIILGEKKDQRIVVHLIYTILLICILIYEMHSLKNIKRIINKKKVKGIYLLFLGLILFINSIFNSFIIISNINENIGNFYIGMGIILSLLDLIISITMYGIFASKEKLRSLNVSKIYIKSSSNKRFSRIEGKILYASDNGVYLYNEDRRIFINKSEIYKIEFK
ncbi:hypothetical protein FDF74_04695 [Clostridium niameyense]|uniref:Uncharacterized protein n=1 Tax=Clostridium niameyense TaxID=1622073 RepID=A0A6M0R8E7_9CLOT|nr:hypothetical protein [Clostridium niameyense]NEZ46513.1 hypothetical protein [Clostridium niameyense]